MPLELLNTFATLGTFIVIAATAIAAIVQLRHMRGGNQIAALNELRESDATEEMQSAHHFVHTQMEEKLQDGAFRYQLLTVSARTDENRSLIGEINAVGNFYEDIGVLVRAQLVDSDLVLAIWSANLADDWKRFEPVVAIFRRKYGDALWENFEYAAVLSQDWLAQHPKGTFPAGTRRITIADEWAEADAQYVASLAPA